MNRREMLRRTAAGLAAVGVGSLTLPLGAEATPDSGQLGAYGDYLRARGESPDATPHKPQDAPADDAPERWVATEDNILGPFYRPGAPIRGKVTPPLEPGRVLLIAGRVWGLDTRKPLPGAVIDLWQANEQGRYDNDDPDNPPAPDTFVNRCRIITGDDGRYEYETIHPGPYMVGPRAWRPPHIHYLVRAEGYRTLITQLYFHGDPHQERDPFIRPSLIITLRNHQRGNVAWNSGVFDIVLARA